LKKTNKITTPKTILSLTLLETHIVPPDISNIRLSDYAVGVFRIIATRKGIKKAIKKGYVWIDGMPADTGRWVQAGQVIQLMEPEPKPVKIFKLPLPILFEDEYIAVIDKPAGIVVSGNQYRTIQNALFFNLTLSQMEDALPCPMPAHRLDHATSGLLIIAKTRKARVVLGKLFENKQIEKKYQAIVIGKTPTFATINIPVDGKIARTKFETNRIVRSLKNDYLTLLDLFPTTGRTHQLRIHLAESGWPILGDKLYGIEGMILKNKGLFLTAVGLSFAHPITQEWMNITKDAPAKFGLLLEREQRRWDKRQG